MASNVAVKRGCGVRAENGIYLVTPTSSKGKPIQFFLIDPPVRLDPALGVSPIGITMIEQNGVTHVIDWIGSSHYSNVADFIEETARFGLSRRVASTVDFSRITQQSRWIGVHARAIIENPERYWAAIDEEGVGLCPKSVPAHEPPTPSTMCAQLYWSDVEGGTPADGVTRAVKRTMPSFDYLARRAPEYAEPLYAPAMFISLPIKGIDVIRSKSGLHEVNAEKAAASGLPVSIEEE
jgi:hypothetical protein